MADRYTTVLLQADAWVECDDYILDTRVADAIERWHVEHELAIPADAEFVAAKWSMPVGTTMGCHPLRPQAEQLRVEMPNGNRYLLTIDREGGGGDDGTGECIYLNVRHGLVGKRGELVGACLTIACFLLLGIFA